MIALYTGKGIPMLWHGQEFAENWGVPEGGLGRNLFERPLHWEFFYDEAGRALVRLHRVMAMLRRNHRALRSRGYFYYYYDEAHLQNGVLAYRRRADADGASPAEDLIVVLNFAQDRAEHPARQQLALDFANHSSTCFNHEEWSAKCSCT